MDTPAPRRRFDIVAYLKLVRFPLVFTAIADSVAGYMLAMSDDRFFSPTLWLLALASSGLYLFGMALNDIADVEKDRVSAPSKVLPSGRVSLKGAWTAASALLLGSLAAVLLMPEPTLVPRLIIWGCLLLSIVAYDLHWIKAPPIMGLVRALNVVLGATAVMEFNFHHLSGQHAWKCGLLGLPAFLYGTSLTYVSTLEDGEIDRRKLSIGVGGMALGALLSAMTVSLLFVVKGSTPGARECVPGLIAAWILVGWIVYRARKATDRRNLMLMVRDGVAGYILVDAALVLQVDPMLKGLLVASLLIPAAGCLAIFKKLA